MHKNSGFNALFFVSFFSLSLLPLSILADENEKLSYDQDDQTEIHRGLAATLDKAPATTDADVTTQEAGLPVLIEPDQHQQILEMIERLVAQTKKNKEQSFLESLPKELQDTILQALASYKKLSDGLSISGAMQNILTKMGVLLEEEAATAPADNNGAHQQAYAICLKIYAFCQLLEEQADQAHVHIPAIIRLIQNIQSLLTTGSQMDLQLKDLFAVLERLLTGVFENDLVICVEEILLCVSEPLDTAFAHLDQACFELQIMEKKHTESTPHVLQQATVYWFNKLKALRTAVKNFLKLAPSCATPPNVDTATFLSWFKKTYKAWSGFQDLYLKEPIGLNRTVGDITFWTTDMRKHGAQGIDLGIRFLFLGLAVNSQKQETMRMRCLAVLQGGESLSALVPSTPAFLEQLFTHLSTIITIFGDYVPHGDFFSLSHRGLSAAGFKFLIAWAYFQGFSCTLQRPILGKENAVRHWWPTDNNPFQLAFDRFFATVTTKATESICDLWKKHHAHALHKLDTKTIGIMSTDALEDIIPQFVPFAIKALAGTPIVGDLPLNNFIDRFDESYHLRTLRNAYERRNGIGSCNTKKLFLTHVERTLARYVSGCIGFTVGKLVARKNRGILYRLALLCGKAAQTSIIIGSVLCEHLGLITQETCDEFCNLPQELAGDMKERYQELQKQALLVSLPGFATTNIAPLLMQAGLLDKNEAVINDNIVLYKVAEFIVTWLADRKLITMEIMTSLLASFEQDLISLPPLSPMTLLLAEQEENTPLPVTPVGNFIDNVIKTIKEHVDEYAGGLIGKWAGRSVINDLYSGEDCLVHQVVRPGPYLVA